jgi:HK97 family phage major capsid protein
MASVAENIKKLQEERAAAWEKAKPLVDLLEKENRDFTAEERQTWDALNAEMDERARRIDDLKRVQETDKAVDEFRRQLEGTEDVIGEIAKNLRGMFAKNPSLTEFELPISSREFTRALSAGTAAAGGNTIPSTFWTEFVQPLRNFSSILQAGARIITTASGETITIPRLASPGAAGAVAEGGSVISASTDPTFDQVALAVFKYGQYVTASRELVQDSGIDIEALIGDLIGQNIGILLGQKLITGTGTGEPTGLATAATVGVTGATGVVGAPSFDNLIDLFYSVTAPYRVNGKWIVADSAMSTLRKVKDGQQQYIWSPALTADTPDLLLGKPVFTDPNMAAPALNAKSVLFGDVSRYWVRIVNSLEIARSDHAAFSTDQTAFRGILRAGGVLTDASAVKAFKGGAS